MFPLIVCMARFALNDIDTVCVASNDVHFVWYKVFIVCLMISLEK